MKLGDMVDGIDEVHDNVQRTILVQSAAAELGNRLKRLADALGRRQLPVRVRYGRGRLGHSFKRQSPEGFVLDPVAVQMLLPDGRLWTYSRSDSTRFPAGRYYDANTDYAHFVGNRTFPGGREFIFLGAVLGKYTFGFASSQDGSGPADRPGLCAIYGEGCSVRYVTADEAFSAIKESAPTGQASPATEREDSGVRNEKC